MIRICFLLLLILSTAHAQDRRRAMMAQLQRETATGDITTGLQLYIKGDETMGLTASDSSGNSYDFILTTTTFTAAHINNGLSFNGTSTFALCESDPANLSPGAGDQTVSAWVKPGSVGVQQAVWWNYGAANVPATIMYFGTDNKLVAQYIDDGGDSALVASTSTIATTTSNHVAVVRSGTTLSIYWNGAFQNSTNIAALGTITVSDGTKVPAIGHYWDGVSAALYWTGWIDEVKAWSRALSATDIAMEYAR